MSETAKGAVKVLDERRTRVLVAIDMLETAHGQDAELAGLIAALEDDQVTCERDRHRLSLQLQQYQERLLELAEAESDLARADAAVAHLTVQLQTQTRDRTALAQTQALLVKDRATYSAADTVVQ